MKFFYALMLVALLNCCVPQDTINDGFQEKYSEAIDSLKAQRTENSAGNRQSYFSTAPSSAEIEGQKMQYHTYSGVTKFGQESAQSTLPGAENYYSPTSQNSAAPEIFEIRYNLDPPIFFRRPGIEFDNIAIPSQDAYGVKTAMSEKSYFSPGGNLLKGSIDKVLDQKGEFDDENAEILVKEKKQILRKKLMKQIFDGNVELAKNDDSEQDAQAEEKKSAKKDDKKNQKKAENSSKNSNNNTSGFTIRAAQ